jgi:PPOX class probable F420-dependent enzyme
MALPDSAKELIRTGALGHLVTLGRDGEPHVTCVWAAVEGDDLLTAHLNRRLRKLENVRRDPRVAISFEGTTIHPPGLREYVVVYGRAAIEEAGAPELLQALARVPRLRDERQRRVGGGGTAATQVAAASLLLAHTELARSVARG